MVELEIYAAGVRNSDKILELGRELEAFPGLRYKVDSNHDIVYLEADTPVFTLQDIRSAFMRLGLAPKIVGTIPPELQADKKKTQPLKTQPLP